MTKGAIPSKQHLRSKLVKIKLLHILSLLSGGKEINITQFLTKGTKPPTLYLAPNSPIIREKRDSQTSAAKQIHITNKKDSFSPIPYSA